MIVDSTQGSKRVNETIQPQPVVQDQSSYTPPSPPIESQKTTKVASQNPLPSISAVNPSIFQITIDKKTSEIQIIKFLDSSDQTQNKYITLYPSCTSTIHRIRAARSILCNQAHIIDTSLTITDSDIFSKIVSILLKGLQFREVINMAGEDYESPLETMEWIREKGIRELCKWYGKEEWIPIISEWVGVRKRNWNTFLENDGGEEEYGVGKRRNMEEVNGCKENEGEIEDVVVEEDEEDVAVRGRFLTASSQPTSPLETISTDISGPKSPETNHPPKHFSLIQTPLDNPTKIDGNPSYILSNIQNPC